MHIIRTKPFGYAQIESCLESTLKTPMTAPSVCAIEDRLLKEATKAGLSYIWRFIQRLTIVSAGKTMAKEAGLSTVKSLILDRLLVLVLKRAFLFGAANLLGFGVVDSWTVGL